MAFKSPGLYFGFFVFVKVSKVSNHLDGSDLRLESTRGTPMNIYKAVH